MGFPLFLKFFIEFNPGQNKLHKDIILIKK